MNSFFNRFIGHSLTEDEMVSLHDVYEELNPNRRKLRASYIFQFLWRDLTSEFDVLGPYYSSHDGMKHKFRMTCILSAIHSFHLYNFETMVLVLDGASSNLAAMKYFTQGKGGMFGINDNPTVDDPHYVKTCFINPFTGKKIFCVPCPSHEVSLRIISKSIQLSNDL